MNTPVLSLPYPISTDTADVPRDVKALAEATESTLTVPVVTALPVSVHDGRTVDYVFASEPGVSDPAGTGVWRLRYDAAVTDGYPWRFVGGSEYAVRADGYWDAADTTSVQNDPDLFYAVPLAGWWDVFPSVYGSFSGGSYVQSRIAVYDAGGVEGNSFSGDTSQAAPDAPLTVPSGRLDATAG